MKERRELVGKRLAPKPVGPPPQVGERWTHNVSGTGVRVLWVKGGRLSYEWDEEYLHGLPKEVNIGHFVQYFTKEKLDGEH